MPLQRTHKVLLASAVGVLVLALLLAVLKNPQELLGRVIEGDAFLLLQVRADYDRDGGIGFDDFTIFAAQYEEDI